MSTGTVAAHRGARRQAPENTLAAFRAALALGASAVELDVHLTSDERVIVIHDDWLERTTDGYGPVHRLTYREIAALDAGSWFSPRFAGERVPLLEEVLDLTAGQARLTVELKGAAGEVLAERTVDVLGRKSALERTVVMSFDLDAALAAARQPAVPTVLAIVGEPLHDQLAFVRATGLRGLNQAAERWDAPTIIRFHEDGRIVHGSLVDDPAALRRFFLLGGDLADSDEPGCFAPRASAP